MKTRPRVAAWLLRQFVGGPMRDSVIGDIEEQFARGGSSTWYWRQVLPAILFGLKADLCERPFAVIGSVILTSAVSIVWVELTIDTADVRITEPITANRSEEHTSELQSQSNLVCRLLLEKKKNKTLEPSSS